MEDVGAERVLLAVVVWTRSADGTARYEGEGRRVVQTEEEEEVGGEEEEEEAGDGDTVGGAWWLTVMVFATGIDRAKVWYLRTQSSLDNGLMGSAE